MNPHHLIGIGLCSIAIAAVGDPALAGLMVRYSADAGGTPSPDTIVEQPNGLIDFSGGDGSTQESFDPDNPIGAAIIGVNKRMAAR